MDNKKNSSNPFDFGYFDDIFKEYFGQNNHKNVGKANDASIKNDLKNDLKNNESIKASYVNLEDEINRTLNSFVGMTEIKQQIMELNSSIEFQLKRKSLGLPSSHMVLHTVMLGNPGTGKTSLARVLGKMYKQMGILSNGHVVEVHGRDFIGEYVGHSERKIKEIIEKAQGGLLFIDEAYTLIKKNSSNDFGHDVINILTKEMEDNREKFIVVAAGYRSEMLDFLKDNPGLKDRFPIIFNFDDYSAEELFQIFQIFCDKDMNIISNDSVSILKKEISRICSTKTKEFSNARAVRNLYENILRRLSIRTKKYNVTDSIGLCTIISEDVLPNNLRSFDFNNIDPTSELNRLIGMATVKQQIKELISYKVINREREQNGYSTKPLSHHMVMTGNPGTGKTTIARLIGKIYKSLGFLTSGHLVEVSRNDLIAGFIGQSELKTNSVIETAIGGILFIDEAYSLYKEGDNKDFGKEVTEVLLKKMEDYRDNLIVVVAGYPVEMHKFLNSNPGLKSRFSVGIHFDDFSNNELIEIFKKYCLEEGYVLTVDGENALYERICSITRNQSFGNAREIRNIFEGSIKQQAHRLYCLNEVERSSVLNILEKEDIIK